jgi:hypothetical protein
MADDVAAARDLFSRVKVTRLTYAVGVDMRNNLEVGRHFAMVMSEKFSESGGIPVAFWVFAARDPATLTPQPHTFVIEPNPEAPDDFLTRNVVETTVRAIAKRGDALAVVSTAEAWIRRQVSDEEYEAVAARGLSQDPKREEVAFLVVETRERAITWVAPIRRPDGQKAYVDAFAICDGVGVGRFAGFLREVH